MKRHTHTNPVIVPFTVAIDGREKARYTFDGLTSDAKEDHRPLMVPTAWQHLKSGDYSIQGLEERVAVERKSLADLYGSLGGHRDRFEAEHWRLSLMDAAVVVIEASWREILTTPPPHSRLFPKTVWRTSIAWQLRYGVPWVPADTRRLGEIYTFRFLEKFWKEHDHGGDRQSDGNADAPGGDEAVEGTESTDR